MKIILLFGTTNCGKTSTIKAVYDSLKSHSDIIKYEEIGNADGDICSVLKYHGALIAICSMGDYSNFVCDRIKEYDQMGCSIFICACNDKFVRPFTRIEQYKGSKLIRKTVCDIEEGRADVNQKDASCILQVVDQMMMA